MSAAERMRRYRLRKAGRPDGTRRACAECGTIISRFAPLTEYLCCICGTGRGQTCKRGHDLSVYGRVSWRGQRQTTTCGECKRIRDAGYARVRRQRERV